MAATAQALERANEAKKRGPRPADGKLQSQAPVDPSSTVARQFMLMSEAHDRIRMKVLAAGQGRAR